MKVILLKDVRGVGRQGEVVEVKDGYAMNALIPQRAAEQATPATLAAHQARMRELERVRTEAREALRQAVRSLEGARLTKKARATEKGGLFESVTHDDIVRLVAEEKGVTLPASAVVLDRPIKQTGEHTLHIRAEGAEARVTLAVEAA